MLHSWQQHLLSSTVVDKVPNNHAQLPVQGRDACFNFAENTEATLTGTDGAPSTMTNCNTNWNEWGGALST